MLNRIIEFALRHRLIVIGLALALIVTGSAVIPVLPIDVLPSLTRPRVTIVTECGGLAPEEVEQQVTATLEAAVNGATGVMDVRSSSDIGLSVIYVEFDWNADIYKSRQIVQERIATVMDQFPENIKPQLGPISSLLGQIMLIGMWSEDGTTGPLELRTYADWVVGQRIKSIDGVSQVIAMGGGRKQFQVLADLHKMHQYDVTLEDMESALAASNINVAGGYVDSSSQELIVRGLGRIKTAEEIREVVVKVSDERPVLVQQVANVREGAQTKRGDSSVNGRDAVVLVVQKQPNADTRRLTENIRDALAGMSSSLPPDVVVQPTYEQRDFIDHGIKNVVHSLRDGAILVTIVLFLFLLNFRPTLITLTAIPLSIVVTALVFRWFEMTINVMTLGGLAVAMGELVDDAIVDVENIFRRLRQNRRLENPRPVLNVIFEASVEVRNAIILSTMLVIVVFSPLFALSGISGRMFTPLGIAYFVSILASTVVSLTVTPVLSYFLMTGAAVSERKDGRLVRWLKSLVEPLIRFSMDPMRLASMLGVTAVMAVGCGFLLANMGSNYLPDFDEGAVQVNLVAAASTSLETSREICRAADREFMKLVRTDKNPDGPLLWFTSRTGRAEQDEHVMGVNVSEYVMTLNPDVRLSRRELREQLENAVADLPSVADSVEQPIAHLISHMLSGVETQIAIKLYGDDLTTLRRKAEQIKQAIVGIEGMAEPMVEQQLITPQFRIEVRRDQLAYYGINAQYVNDFIETAMKGRVVSQIIDGQRRFDLMLRLGETYRTDLNNLSRIPLELPNGRRVPLSAVARLYEGGGPNTIKRENGRRRIVVRVNTTDRDVGSVLADIQQRIPERVSLPEGYFIEYGGQFEAGQAATRRIAILSVVALAIVFVILYSTFPSSGIVMQILIALPAAFVGGALALWATGQILTVAAQVGFISLGGIAARNGLLLISTYLDEVGKKGFTTDAIVTGSLERMSPVLMTALTTGIGLVPLVWGGPLPGREFLLPIATVILGGLVTSTLCEFLVRPGLFYIFSEQAAESLARKKKSAFTIHVDAA